MRKDDVLLEEIMNELNLIEKIFVMSNKKTIKRIVAITRKKIVNILCK